MSIKIEKMQEQDIGQMVELYEQLMNEKCDQTVFANNYSKIKDNKDYIIFVAREDDMILGTAMGIVNHALDCDFLVIEAVVVRDSMRGKGIGKQIFKVLDLFASEHDCEYAILCSSGFRKKAHKFYEKVGFTDDVRGFRKVYVTK